MSGEEGSVASVTGSLECFPAGRGNLDHSEPLSLVVVEFVLMPNRLQNEPPVYKQRAATERPWFYGMHGVVVFMGCSISVADAADGARNGTARVARAAATPMNDDA